MQKRVTSRYSIIIPLRRGRGLLYNSLNAGLSLLDANEYAAYRQIQAGEIDGIAPEILSAFEEAGYVVPEETDELEILRQEYNAHRFDPRAMVLTIAPTMACNFGCDYCFQGQDKPKETMSQEVQDAVVALVERASPSVKHLGVSWYGGEPLLRLRIIESLSDRLMEVCKRRGISYSAMVVTNGYMLSLEAARSLHQRKVTWIQVTLDGTPEFHDSRRYLLSKKGSFEKIIHNLRAMVDEVPTPVVIRVNIDDRNSDDIHKLIDYLAEVGLGHRKNFKMYFAPIEALTEGCHTVQDLTLGKARYGQLEAELYRHGFRAGLTNLPYPPRFHGTCGAVRPGGLVILPSGDLHKCWDTVSWPDRRVGTIWNPDAVNDHALTQRWLKWTPFDNDTCKNCKLLPNCAGACAYKFVHAETTRGEAAVLPCPSWKYNLKERLLFRAVALGKITEDDFDRDETRTDPGELCADIHVDGGKVLPAEMQRYYEQQAKKKFRLPVLENSGAAV